MERSAHGDLGPTVFPALAIGATVAAVFLGILLEVDSAIPTVLLSQALLFGVLGTLNASTHKLARLRMRAGWSVPLLAALAFAAPITAAVMDLAGTRGAILSVLVTVGAGSLALLLGLAVAANLASRGRTGRHDA